MLPVTRYLVTGGCGFIGSHLVEALLRDGHDVRVLDNLSSGRTQNLHPAAELIFGDVADASVTRAAMRNSDGCFHLAASTLPDADWLDSHRANLTGTVTVLDAARRDKLPVVFASSCAVYGDSGGLRLAESLAPQPRSAQGADAFSCEWQGRIAAGQYGVPNAALRMFHVYGPRQPAAGDHVGVVAVFARRLLAGLPLLLQGDGEQTRDFVFVGDAVAILRAAMQRLENQGLAVAEAFNLCTGRATRIRELAQVMAQICNRGPDLQLAAPRANDVRHIVGNPDFAALALKLQAQTALEAGLQLLFSQPASTGGGYTPVRLAPATT